MLTTYDEWVGNGHDRPPQGHACERKPIGAVHAAMVKAADVAKHLGADHGRLQVDAVEGHEPAEELTGLCELRDRVMVGAHVDVAALAVDTAGARVSEDRPVMLQQLDLAGDIALLHEVVVGKRDEVVGCRGVEGAVEAAVELHVALVAHDGHAWIVGVLKRALVRVVCGAVVDDEHLEVAVEHLSQHRVERLANQASAVSRRDHHTDTRPNAHAATFQSLGRSPSH